MERGKIRQQVHRMRRDWDRRALENARYYVATGKQEWSDEEFFASGEQEVQEQILSDLGNICQGRDPREMKVLEIGCGAGRMTRALAKFFGSVYAVDISPHMVKQAKAAVADLQNAYVFRNNGRDLSVVRGKWWNRFGIGRKLEFDFAFSCLVFQHIPSREIIENYVAEVGRLLRPGALFKFQVQGATTSGTGGDSSWVGCSFNAADARQLAESKGFELRYEKDAGEQYYWLWYFKKERGA